MQQCQICRQRPADKKNSHLLPSFLIAAAISKGGNTKRDFELTFSLSADDFVESYYGRNITEETIQQVNGRSLTDEELANNKNPFTADYIFCTACETALGHLESIFAERIYSRLKKGEFNTDINDSKGNIIVEVQKQDAALSQLFTYSLFFRCVVAKLQGLRMDTKLLERIRELLLLILSDTIAETASKISTNYEKLFPYPTILTFHQTPDDEDATSNVVMIHHSRQPFFLFINDMTFQLFEKTKHINASVEFLHGLSQVVSNTEVANKLESSYKIVVLSNERRKKILQNVFAFMVTKKVAFFGRIFRLVHERIFYKKASEGLFQHFMHELTSNEASFGERYTLQHFALTMYQFLKNFYGIP